jgi:hypothetical protein
MNCPSAQWLGVGIARMWAGETLLVADGQEKRECRQRSDGGGPLIRAGGLPVVRFEVSECRLSAQPTGAAKMPVRRCAALDEVPRYVRAAPAHRSHWFVQHGRNTTRGPSRAALGAASKRLNFEAIGRTREGRGRRKARTLGPMLIIACRPIARVSYKRAFTKLASRRKPKTHAHL